ncbi:Telomerase protein component 1 like protein [Argiope bruennichi]|uniref:Telomerase protein component 1 like protein n=1 Tax=Argiope bruennichi TaxID=94029 RepID=A0A8T0FQF1_ARGBR|nr:Telomerase protein component 1 like protein [Argiope bruennichi]
MENFRLKKLDHVIVLRGSGSDGDETVKKIIKSFLHKYREMVNPELLYTDVDFFMSNSSLDESDSADGKDVYLGGNATQLVKFIAERSSGGQLTYVENIDLKYDLQNKVVSKKCKKLNVLPEQEKLPVLTKVPKWQTVRIFISSTFKDMHTERDLLIRYVIPELRKRAASVFVKINEVDLRWGITETDCASKRAAELCLLEAQKSDLFIGILGDRYGTIFNYDPPDSPELQWVKDYPRGLSITELEMHAGALREDKLLKKKAFFYIRNNSFLNFMPEKYRSHFESENPESNLKVEALKSKIRSSGLKVYDGYTCNFAGVLDGKPVLSGLDNFGKTVLNNTWTAIKEMHEEDPYADDVMEEEMCQQSLLHSFDSFVEVKNSPVGDLMKEIEKHCGIFLITGSPGSGKTTFVVDLLRRLKNFSVIKFFVGLSPRSTELSYMLQYISNSIARTFPVSSIFPKLTSDVRNHFPDILQEAVNSTGNSDFVLVIDGLDHLSADDQLLDWLPINLPQGLRLICSASDTSYAFKVLNERCMHEDIMHVNLTAINQVDRENVIRRYLQLYGKSLDESSFNNQMLLLVTKKDSGTPLYLRIACDYLRSYASFDNFMSTLQSLPSSMPLLFQEIILQMENEYGSVLVQTMLTLLSITKEGLDDADLHTLLSLVSLEKEKRSFLSFHEAISQLKKLSPDNMLSQVTYCSVMHTVSSFAFGCRRFKKYSLIGSEFEKAVKKYYLNKNYSNFSKYMHRILAAYYYITCDFEDNGTWKGRSGSAFRGLIFHLFHGSCYQELADYLCCLQFLETAFSVEASDLLLEYYSLLFEERRTGSSEALRKIHFPLLSSFYDFVSRNLHIFQIYPDLVMQQALNEPSDSLVKLNLQKNDVYKSSVVECLSISDHDPRIATLRGFFKNITSASCQKVASHALLGSEDGYLKVLDFASKKIIRSVKSHSSAITFICSAGKNRICTASTDTTLSIWSTVDYSRISVLKGHKHIVSCCCADSSSTILLSSGWDNSVRLWSLRDGSSISVIDFGCPVNCIDHHPTKQQVACGLWSGNIEIWDTVSLEKKLTLSSSGYSVKSIVYTLDGLNIITSYMNSDVTIWSSEQGLKISCLKGHVLPVKSISYSPEGDKIISGSDDCTLKVWPAESGLSVRTFSECKCYPISVLEILSPNHLAVGFQNSDMWVMDMSTGYVTTKMSLEADLVSCFSKFDSLTYASGNTGEKWTDLSVIFGTKFGKIMIGNLQTSEITTVGTLNARVTTVIHNVRIIVCGSSEGDIGLFSYPDMNSKIVTGAHGGSVTALNLFTKDENVWVITAGSDKVIKFWEIDYEELVMRGEFFSKHYDYVTCCSFYPNSLYEQAFLTGSHDNNIILQNECNDKTLYEGLKTSVVNMAFTDKYILGCGSDGSVAMWTEEGKLLSYIPGVEQSSVVLSYRVDKDISGEFDITLAFVDRDGSVKIRKPNQRAFSYSLEGHNRGITSCCTSQSGEILSCSLDGTVNLWKIPEEPGDIHPEHLASITDFCFSVSREEIISSDAYGNVIIWKLDFSTDTPFLFAGKKTYAGGYVKSLSLLQDKKLVCAVTQTADDGDKYFIDVLYFERSTSDNNSIYSFHAENSHYFDSEVLCLDASGTTETIVVGLKSGNFVLINSDVKKTINVSNDWVLGINLYSNSVDSPEFIFAALLNGTVKCIQIEEPLKNDDSNKVEIKEIQCPDLGNVPVFISAFCCANCDNVYCGDSQGWLRRYSNSPISKKIHDDAITGIAVCGVYVFTCSLDKTLKGWNSALNQVCLFHSSVPITSLAGCEIVLTSTVPTYILVIGTSSGAIQLLQFHDKKNN